MSITKDDTAANLAANLRQQLFIQDMSQAELSFIAGVTAMTLSRILRQEQMPSASILARLARALQVTSDSLLATPPKRKSGNSRNRA